MFKFKLTEHEKERVRHRRPQQPSLRGTTTGPRNAPSTLTGPASTLHRRGYSLTGPGEVPELLRGSGTLRDQHASSRKSPSTPLTPSSQTTNTTQRRLSNASAMRKTQAIPPEPAERSLIDRMNNFRSIMAMGSNNAVGRTPRRDVPGRENVRLNEKKSDQNQSEKDGTGLQDGGYNEEADIKILVPASLGGAIPTIELKEGHRSSDFGLFGNLESERHMVLEAIVSDDNRGSRAVIFQKQESWPTWGHDENLPDGDNQSQTASLRIRKSQRESNNQIANLPHLRDALKELVLSLPGTWGEERQELMDKKSEMIRQISRLERVQKKKKFDSRRVHIPRDASPPPPEPREKIACPYKPINSKRMSGPVKPTNSKKEPHPEHDDWDTELTLRELKRRKTIIGELDEVEKKLVEGGLVVFPAAVGKMKGKRLTMWNQLGKEEKSIFDDDTRAAGEPQVQE